MSKITEEVYETFDRLNRAHAALDSQMIPLVQADAVEAAFLAERAKHALSDFLGYDNYDEFLEAIWKYERREVK